MTHPKKPSKNTQIEIGKNGPYLVSGSAPLRIQEITPNREGLSWDWTSGKRFVTQGDYALCRCGESKTKPFCDGSHKRTDFDGAETASRAPYTDQAEKIEGPTMLLSDQENLCAFARFCDPGGKIWGLIEQTENPDVQKLVIREAMHCPSGRLTLQDKKTGKDLEQPRDAAIGIIEDPALGCSGPLWIEGGISIQSADGTTYETRNRVTLCRCGRSDNKPFCNGSHAADPKFQDGL
jgi:CDGSH-type Zn-finger protein